MHMKMLVKWKSVWTFSLVNIHLTMSFGSNKAMIYLLVVTKCSWTYWCSVRFKRKRLLKYAVKTYNSSFVVVLLKLDKENVLMLLSDLWCGYFERVAAHQSSTLQFRVSFHLHVPISKPQRTRQLTRSFW